MLMMEKERGEKTINRFENHRATCQLNSEVLCRFSTVRKESFHGFQNLNRQHGGKEKLILDLCRFKFCCPYCSISLGKPLSQAKPQVLVQNRGQKIASSFLGKLNGIMLRIESAQ